MAHFPVFLDLSTRKCMIFGGGKIALRKIETLLKYEADLEVISRSVIPEISAILPRERIHYEDLSGEEAESWLVRADLVIAATSDREINHHITSWCAEHKVLVNVIDAPEECTFLFPSVVKKGDISIGINTGAQSPVVSKRIRQDIEESIPDYYADIAEQLGELRAYVKKEYPEEKERRRILKSVAAEAFRQKRRLSPEEIEQIILIKNQ